MGEREAMDQQLPTPTRGFFAGLSFVPPIFQPKFSELVASLIHAPSTLRKMHPALEYG